MKEFISARVPFLKPRLIFIGSISLYVFAAALGVATYAIYSDPNIIQETIGIQDTIKTSIISGG